MIRKLSLCLVLAAVGCGADDRPKASTGAPSSEQKPVEDTAKGAKGGKDAKTPTVVGDRKPA